MRKLGIGQNEIVRIQDSGGPCPPLILLHGLANSLEIWERVQPRLAHRFRLIAFDWPGFGESSRPRGRYDGRFFATRLAAVMNALDIERAHLAGYSMGASAILHFSDHNADRIDHAILAAPGSFGRRVHPLMLAAAMPGIGAWLARPHHRNNRTTLRLAIHDPSQVTKDLQDRTDRHAAIAGSARTFHSALTAGVGLLGSRGITNMARRAQAFPRPALLLWGANDRVFPVRNAARALRLMPDARLTMIPECGHYPQWEQPDAFCDAVEHFLP
ncbi:alpha/beta fold hydrolase [Sphingobium sp. AP49]|uniref:alpha/beta fold hydrolase n=1 Tax=Sphingobium sp. AP49 TaxID=1144307 RepID=UPI00026ED999|nr:alpha/beta fold hydrolase [Sphingobium sp. AP49]WHO39353.1 alpha/beta fold hydrolase [Sphingobium sp. AP49]